MSNNDYTSIFFEYKKNSGNYFYKRYIISSMARKGILLLIFLFSLQLIGQPYMCHFLCCQSGMNLNFAKNQVKNTCCHPKQTDDSRSAESNHNHNCPANPTSGESDNSCPFHQKISDGLAHSAYMPSFISFPLYAVSYNEPASIWQNQLDSCLEMKASILPSNNDPPIFLAHAIFRL